MISCPAAWFNIKKISYLMLYLCISGGLLSSLTACTQHPAPPAQTPGSPSHKTGSPAVKNVLFISIDDLKPALGSYGNTQIKTPHIDQIAAGGLQFNHAYAQQAVCVPSRSSVLTGLRPSTLGATKFKTHFRDPSPQVVTLPQIFKQSGYQVFGVGKVFHHRDPVSWNERVWVPEPEFVYPMYAKKENIEQQKKIVESGRAIPKDPETWWGKGRYWVPAHSWESAEVDDNAYLDGKITQKAIEYIRQNKEQPFFIAVGFFRPHIPFIAPRKYFDLYPLDEITLPSINTPPEKAPAIALHNWGETRFYTDIPTEGDISDRKKRELIRGYFASISYVDAQIGRLLDELKRQGLKDNTMIVLWSDHGYHLGDLGLWGKYSNFEQSTRTPLIIHAPWQPSSTRQSHQIVELLDIYPTMLDFFNIPTTQKLEGKSLKPLWEKGTDHTQNHFAYSEYTKQDYIGYSVRSIDFRYTYWQPLKRDDGKGEYKELYQYRPGEVETINLAGDKNYQAIQEKLHQKIVTTYGLGY